MARAEATPVVHIDDERFKVTEWRFEQGAQTGWHVHGHDYVIVPLIDGKLLLEEPGGASREAPLQQHVPYSRRTGVEHNVINGGGGFLSFLEVEVVDDALGKRREAVLERFMAAWNDHDVDALMDCMAETCAFQMPSGPDVGGKRHEGRDAVRTAFAGVFETFPDATWRDVQNRVTGDLGVSSWRFVATSRDGSLVDAEGCDLFRFEGELIASKNAFRKMRTG